MLIAREEARLKRLGEKGKNNVFGGGLAAAQNRGRAPSGGNQAKATASYTAPAPAPAPKPAPVYRAPLQSHTSESYHPPPQKAPALGEIITESIIAPSKIVDSEEEAAREEERMMKSIGRFSRPESALGAQTNAPRSATYHPPAEKVVSTIPPKKFTPAPLESSVEEVSLPPPSRAAAPAKPASSTYSAPASSTYSAPASSTYSAPASSSYSAPKPSGYVYPSYKVGKLFPLENGTGNVLPITDLACQLSELSVGLRKDGHALEFRRTVTQDGNSRVESQSFNLPYQVTPDTCKGHYFPNREGGELHIVLGKVITGVAPSGETELLRFTVTGDPNSSQERVTVTVDQQTDHYTFRPGPASPWDTDFVVVLNKAVLEFRGTHSVEEPDGGIKTINSKQTVNLPVAPTLDQIDTGYDSVTIWPNRQRGGPLSIPDQDVRIVLG